MSRKRQTLLSALALLTFVFLAAAALTFFGNPLRQTPLSAQTLPLGEAPHALRLTIRKTGIARLTLAELRKTNLPFDEFSATSLALARDGELVPFVITGEGESASLYFYAEAVSNSSEPPAVYWLAPGRGKTMSQSDRSSEYAGVSVGRLSERWEENDSFQPLATGDDTWLGAHFFAPDSLEVPLTGIQPTGGPGQMQIRVWSSNQSPARPDHHLEILLNGKELASHFWDGIKQETLTLPLLPGDLSQGTNRLVFNVPGDTGAAGESIYLDWISLDYEGDLRLRHEQLHFSSSAQNVRVLNATEDSLAFDVTDHETPLLLINTVIGDGKLDFAGGGFSHRYIVLDPRQAIRPEISLVPERERALTDPGWGADYIAIVPKIDGFQEALTPLLEHRRDQGLRVVVASLPQIYDEFAYGRETPEAIRSFLRHATSAWQPPAPRFALFVGDATYDINGYVASQNQNLLPTHLVFTNYAGYVASDTWFTIFDESNPTPGLAVGRLPVQNVRQLQVIVDKTLTYELDGSPDWLGRALLVADDETRFNTASDSLAEELSRTGYLPQKLYMTENEEIHDAIISALNHGVGIVNYVGHGGIDVWGDETVLRNEDARMLKNGKRLPIFTTFTCLNGYFNHPQIDALAETLLWTADGGIVAAIAPSGRTFTSQQTPLATAFYTSLLTGDARTLGEALVQAKAVAATNPDLIEVVHTFNLLGDPALHFQTPAEAQARQK